MKVSEGSMHQAIVRAFDEPTESLRATLTNAEVEVNVNALTDSIKIGDGAGNTATISTVGARKAMDVAVQDIVISHDSDSIRIGDGVSLVGVSAVGAERALKVDVIQQTTPTGGATSALQTTGNSSLSSIDGKLPATLGAKATSASLAVNIASDQTVPVSGPATDAQLRASPLPVSGTVTANPGAGTFDVTPVAPVATDYLPVRLTDGTSFYTAGGGSGGGSSIVDKAAFTEGAASFTVSGGVYNETIAADPTEDQAAAARITAKRALHTNLRNVAGAEIGTVANPIRVDTTGTTTQPVSGTVTANAGTGTFAVSGPLTDTQLRATAVPVSGTFFQATQPVSAASLPLPTGASTETTLSALNTKVPSSLTVKAASTVAAAADPALVVAVSPNTTVRNADSAGQVQYNFPAGFVRTTDEPRQVFYDPFDSALDTTDRWNAAVTAGGGVAAAVSGGMLTLGSGTTASGYSHLGSQASFTPTIPGWLGISFALKLESPVVTNSLRFWGNASVPGTPTTAAPITDGYGFEIDTTGKLHAVVYAAGVRTSVQDLSAATGNATQPTDTNYHRYICYYRTDRIYWYIDSLATPVATSSFQSPAVQSLPMRLLSVAGATPPASSAILNITGLAIWDTAKNNTTLSDGTFGWRKATVKKASTASAATDTALVVGLHPTSPLPVATAVSNSPIGSVSLGNSLGKTNVMRTGSLVTTAVTADQVILTYTVTAGKTFYMSYLVVDARLTTFATTATNFGNASLESPAATKLITQMCSGAGITANDQYIFAEPIPIAAGTVIRVVCTPAAVTSYTWQASFGGYEK